MLQVARLAPKLLGESSDLVVHFLHSQMNEDGGFKDRAGQSDLYYTMFGMESLIAMCADVPTHTIALYLHRFGSGDGLSLVHLTCLARSWADMPPDLRETFPREPIIRRIESYRSGDGGYNASAGSPYGTVYGCFLALGAYQDLGMEMPNPMKLLDCLEHLRTDDGGYANQSDMSVGLTPVTAAAVMLLRHLDQPLQPPLAEWLLSRCYADGGFFATPFAPIPDLLSTATALHALAGMKVDFERIKEPCMDFIDSLWTNRGGFYGNWRDESLDCEYTYYALLALGHLSL